MTDPHGEPSMKPAEVGAEVAPIGDRWNRVRVRLSLPAALALSPWRSIRAAWDRRRLARLGFDKRLIASLEEGWSAREVDRTARRAVSRWLAPSHPEVPMLLGTAYTVVAIAAVDYPPARVAKGTTVTGQEWFSYLVALVVAFTIGLLLSAFFVIARQWTLTRFGDPDRALGRAAAALLREINKPQTPQLQHRRAVLAAVRALRTRAPRAGITEAGALEHLTIPTEPRDSEELATRTRALMIDHVHGKLINQDDPAEPSEVLNTLFGSRAVPVQATVAIVTLLTAIVGLVKAFTR